MMTIALYAVSAVLYAAAGDQGFDQDTTGSDSSAAVAPADQDIAQPAQPGAGDERAMAQGRRPVAHGDDATHDMSMAGSGSGAAASSEPRVTDEELFQQQVWTSP